MYTPELKKGFIKFLSKLKQVKAYYAVNTGYSLGDSRVKIFCKDLIIQEQLTKELHKAPYTEALLILNFAISDNNLAEMIIERACIRWVEGYSDSLYQAVLCNLREINARPNRDLQPVTDWRAEIKEFGMTLRKGVGLDLFI